MNTTLGLGGSGVRSIGDIQGSPQAFARLGAALPGGRRWGIEVDATASHEFGAGERTVSAGIGAYRVIPSWDRDRVPDATAAGVYAAIDLPVWRGGRRALVISTRGVLLAALHSPIMCLNA